MDNATKKIMNRPSFELEYHGRSFHEAFEYINGLIDKAYEQSKMTKLEMNEMKSLNNEIYDEFMRS